MQMQFAFFRPGDLDAVRKNFCGGVGQQTIRRRKGRKLKGKEENNAKEREKKKMKFEKNE